MSSFSDDRYEIQAKIGEGGVGAVYRAYDKQLKRDVAIKRVLPEGGFETEADATEHLLREATSVSSVQHPHIVTVFDSGVDEDGPYVVMELLDGRTLDEMVERSILTLTDFKEVATQIQEALIAAQELNLVHRDLKPSNVMVTWLPSGRFQVKIVDFGLAKFSPKPSLQTINHGDSVFGSIFFMAPEQFERTELDQRTDMYATGCLYYFCLTGTYPFNGETAAEVMEAHLTHCVRPLKELRPDVPDWLNDWVMWHINRDINHRPENARASLELFLANESASPLAEAAAAPLPASAPVVPTAQAVSAEISTGTGSVSTSGGPKLSFPGAAKTSTQSISERIKTAAQTVKTRPSTITAPQPIAPPPGKAPSIHSTSQHLAPKPSTGSVAALATPPSTAPATAAAAAAPQSAATGKQSVTNATAQQLLSKTGKSLRTKLIIASVLTVFVVIAALFALGRARESRDNQRVNDLLSTAIEYNSTNTPLPMSTRDLQLILSGAQTQETDTDRSNYYVAAKIAEANDGGNFEKIILDEILASGTKPAIRKELLQGVLAQRSNKEIVERAIELANGTSDAQVSRAAIRAIWLSADSSHTGELIDVMINNQFNDTRQEAESLIKRLLSKGEDVLLITGELKEAFASAVQKNARLSLLRTLGASGRKEAIEPLITALKSKAVDDRLAGMAAAGEWPGDELYQPLIDQLADTSEPLERDRAFRSALDILTRDRDRPSADAERMWKALQLEAIRKREKALFIRKIARQPGEWVTGILQGYLRDEDTATADQAQRAIDYRESDGK